MSATSYFAVRSPKNIACSFTAPRVYPGADVAAETSTRPAKYANKHTKATTIVIVETYFNFTPRTGFGSTGATPATTATPSVNGPLAFLCRRFAGLTMDLARDMNLLPDSSPALAATVAISTNDSCRGPDASPVHISAA